MYTKPISMSVRLDLLSDHYTAFIRELKNAKDSVDNDLYGNNMLTLNVTANLSCLESYIVPDLLKGKKKIRNMRAKYTKEMFDDIIFCVFRRHFEIVGSDFTVFGLLAFIKQVMPFLDNLSFLDLLYITSVNREEKKPVLLPGEFICLITNYLNN